jgi:hypothetical protein
MRPVLSSVLQAVRRFRRCGALAVALWGAGAVAQGLLTVQVGGRDALLAGPDDCGASSQVTWTTTITSGLACQDLVLWVTTSTSCGTAPGAGDLVVGTVSSASWISQRTGNFSLLVSALPVFSASDAGGCPLSGVDQKHLICGYSKYSALSDCSGTFSQPIEVKATTPPTVTFDSRPPNPPSLGTVSPLDQALLVTFTAPSDAVTAGLEYRVEGEPGFTQGPEGSASEGALRLTGLENGTRYEVRVWVEDAVGNRSPASPLGAGTPVQSFGFFRTYQDAGGAETGGCSHAGAAAPLLLALLSLWPLARRRSARAGKGDA